MFGLGAAKSDLFDVLYRGPREPAPKATAASVSATGAPIRYRAWSGETYPQGFGSTDIYLPDYWTLRTRSAALFRTNLYARGLIRRLVTSELAKGLEPEAVPETVLLALPGRLKDLDTWTEMVEARFGLYANSPHLCDIRRRCTFGQIQAQARIESLIEGDVLVALTRDEVTGLPLVRLISGSHIQTPLDVRVPKGHEVLHGVELDAQGRHVAFYVQQKDNSYKRLPATGSNGRRNAWLVYGCDKRHEDVRGEPILSLVAQSLKDIGDYRQSTLLKAAANSKILMAIQRDVGANPIGNTPLAGALGSLVTQTIDTPSGQKKARFGEIFPGLVIDGLDPGEKVIFNGSQGVDMAYGDFEKVILSAVAWSIEMPPEVLLESFDKSFSAAQAANSEYKLYLDKVRPWFGANFCAPVYQEWLLSEALHQRIETPGLLDSWRDPRRFDEHAAWMASDWSGQVKAHVDPVKTAKAYGLKVKEGFVSRERATREVSGLKFSRVVQRLKKENELLAEALAPLRGLQSPDDELDDEPETHPDDLPEEERT